VADDRLDQLDYYTLLGVPQDATADGIRDAFHLFALKFHPDRHVGGPTEKIARAEEIFRRGAEAYKVLLEPELRRRYDDGLRDGKLRYDPEVQGDGRPTTGRFGVKSVKARPFVTKAQEAIRSEDWRTARLNLRIALQHEPDNDLLKARLEDVERRLQK
jgi:curved DNA-binding protein CbpA